MTVEVESNFFLKFLKAISNMGVCNISNIAKKYNVTEEFIKIVIESLLEIGYMKEINDNDYITEKSFACKLCPFANECSERLPHVFYEISTKGKNKIRKK